MSTNSSYIRLFTIGLCCAFHLLVESTVFLHPHLGRSWSSWTQRYSSGDGDVGCWVSLGGVLRLGPLCSWKAALWPCQGKPPVRKTSWERERPSYLHSPSSVHPQPTGQLYAFLERSKDWLPRKLQVNPQNSQDNKFLFWGLGWFVIQQQIMETGLPFFFFNIFRKSKVRIGSNLTRSFYVFLFQWFMILTGKTPNIIPHSQLWSSFYFNWKKNFTCFIWIEISQI